MVGRPGYVLVDGRFVPADMLYAIEYPEAAERQRAKLAEVPPPEAIEVLQLFDNGQIPRGRKPSPEQLYQLARHGAK